MICHELRHEKQTLFYAVFINYQEWTQIKISSITTLNNATTTTLFVSSCDPPNTLGYSVYLGIIYFENKYKLNKQL